MSQRPMEVDMVRQARTQPPPLHTEQQLLPRPLPQVTAQATDMLRIELHHHQCDNDLKHDTIEPYPYRRQIKKILRRMLVLGKFLRSLRGYSCRTL